jgi:hypothetical protein
MFGWYRCSYKGHRCLALRSSLMIYLLYAAVMLLN